MAAIRKHEDANACLELAPQFVKLVVNELPIITDPGLVHAVFFLALGIINLPAVPRVCQEEQITGLERLGCPKDCIRYGLGSGRSGQEQRA